MNVLQSLIVQITVPPPNTGSERQQERMERGQSAFPDGQCCPRYHADPNALTRCRVDELKEE